MRTGDEDSWELAYGLAREKFAGLDPQAVCRRSGAELRRVSAGGAALAIRYLGRDYLVSLPAGEVTPEQGGGEVPLWLKVVLLHYLNTARGTPVGGEIDLRSLAGGRLYYPNFEKRVTDRLTGEFGKNPSLFVEAGKRLGGEKVGYGDAAIRMRVLPRVAVTFVLWGEDAEFGGRASVLFDASVGDYLPTEDVVVICQQLVGELVRRKGG